MWQLWSVTLILCSLWVRAIEKAVALGFAIGIVIWSLGLHKMDQQ